MLRATGYPRATPGESAPTKDGSAISFWTRHPPNWARHRVDHGTITGRGGDKFDARKAVFGCNGCAFSPRPPREKIVRVMSAGGIYKIDPRRNVVDIHKEIFPTKTLGKSVVQPTGRGG